MQVVSGMCVGQVTWPFSLQCLMHQLSIQIIYYLSTIYLLFVYGFEILLMNAIILIAPRVEC